MKVLVIVPAFNEYENIEKVIYDLESNSEIYEYIIIDDCSNDNTREYLEKNNIPHISLPVNLGLAGAVQTGYKYAWKYGFDCAIQFDGDGQHQAKYIAKMIEEIKNGADIVIGSRFIAARKGFSLRMVGSRILTFIIRMFTGKQINDPTSGMRMLNKKMIFDYAFNMNRKPEPDTLVYQIRHGAKVIEISAEMNERTAGTSLYNGILNSMKYMIKMIISIMFLSY